MGVGSGEQTISQKQICILHLIFHRISVAEVLFCSFKKRLTPKIWMSCLVIINSLFLNLSCA